MAVKNDRSAGALARCGSGLLTGEARFARPAEAQIAAAGFAFCFRAFLATSETIWSIQAFSITNELNKWCYCTNKRTKEKLINFSSRKSWRTARLDIINCISLASKLSRLLSLACCKVKSFISVKVLTSGRLNRLYLCAEYGFELWKGRGLKTCSPRIVITIFQFSTHHSQI